MQEILIFSMSRFAYDGEWKFADLLTMSATKLAVKFVMDTVTGEKYSHGVMGANNAMSCKIFQEE